MRTISQCIGLTAILMFLLMIVLSLWGQNIGELSSDGKQKTSKSWAVLIGIEDYIDPAINDLNYTVDDAKAFYGVLTDPKYGARTGKIEVVLLYRLIPDTPDDKLLLIAESSRTY